MSDDESARSWNEAAEALERPDFVMPQSIRPAARTGRRPIFATLLSAVVVVLLSLVLGHRPRFDR